MESSIELVVSVMIFVIVLSWATISIINYQNSKYEELAKANLLEYARTILSKVIADKRFCNASLSPNDYGISAKISIRIESKHYYFLSEVNERNSCNLGNQPPKFIDEAEAMGAYVNSSIIIVRVSVYGLP